jgi:hypothetical protein
MPRKSSHVKGRLPAQPTLLLREDKDAENAIFVVDGVAYEEFPSINKAALEVGMSRVTLSQLLRTNGFWEDEANKRLFKLKGAPLPPLDEAGDEDGRLQAPPPPPSDDAEDDDEDEAELALAPKTYIIECDEEVEPPARSTGVGGGALLSASTQEGLATGAASAAVALTATAAGGRQVAPAQGGILPLPFSSEVASALQAGAAAALGWAEQRVRSGWRRALLLAPAPRRRSRDFLSSSSRAETGARGLFVRRGEGGFARCRKGTFLARIGGSAQQRWRNNGRELRSRAPGDGNGDR